MDPNETLQELRRLLLWDDAPDDPVGMAVRYGAVIGHFEALDEWLTNGGFLPTDWKG